MAVGEAEPAGGTAAVGDSSAAGIAWPGLAVDSPAGGSQWLAVGVVVSVVTGIPRPVVRPVSEAVVGAGSRQGAGPIGLVVVAVVGFPQS